ncbi:DUF6668 family protein [Streptantibioticus rubrisoli]|uniref:DUF6668 family protein n=1 Tax=Streptantibioticus rubrisoli TaxID=1387313 RepID=UPI00362220DA
MTSFTLTGQYGGGVELQEVNPWVTRPTQAVSPVQGAIPQSVVTHAGPTRPQPNAVDAPDTGLPTFPVSASRDVAPPSWWWVGCHGGAGASTLATALAHTNAADAHGRWPAPQRPDLARVVVVARTHFHGLTMAQAAARQWASGSTPEGVEVLGLVLVIDAPGKLPKPLREFAHLVSGGFPRVWEIPWVEEFRCGAPPAPQHPAFRRIEQDLSRVVSGGTPHA